MLEYLRNAADKPVAKFLMGVLIFSFVGWGVAEWVLGIGSSNRTLMRVGDASISAEQYEIVKQNELRRIPDKRALYADESAMAAFRAHIVEKLSTDQMLMNHASDMGYVVSSHKIADEIRSIPEFQENGKFSRARYETLLQYSGLSESKLENNLRIDALQEMVKTPIMTRPKTPTFATTATYNARNAERAIEFATIKYSDFKAGNPTDDALREYYAQHPIIVPESRDFSYVFIPGDISKPDVEEAVRKTAEEIESELMGEEMDIVAKRHGAKLIQHKNISRGKLPADKNLTEEVIFKIFDMNVGKIGHIEDIPKTGLVILRLDNITPEHNAKFEDIKKQIVGDWRTTEQKKQAYIRANEKLTALNKGEKLTGGRTANVSRTNGAPVPVLVSAFKNEIGQNTIVEGNNEYYVLHVDHEKTPAIDTKKMESIATDVMKMTQVHMVEDYSSYLKRKYPIKINEKVYRNTVR